MRIRSLVRNIVLLAGAMPGPALAQPVIDSFETGTVDLTAAGDTQVSGNYTVAAPGHALAPVRHVLVTSYDTGSNARARVNAWTVVDDKLGVEFGPAGGFAMLRYLPPDPVDVTALGLNDRIEVNFTSVSPNGTVELRIWDGLGGLAIDMRAIDMGPVVFPFSSLGGVDLSHVTHVEVWIEHLVESAYEVRDIRAMRGGASWLSYDVQTATVAGPPYPVPPVVFDVTNAMPSDHHGITLASAVDIATGGATGIALTGMDAGGDMGAGPMGAVQVGWDLAGVPYRSTAFDVRVDIDALSGIQPEPFLPALPVVTASPTGVVLLFDVHFLSDTGALVASSRRHLLLDARPGQDIAFDDVIVSPPDPLRGDAAGFRVTFDVLDAGDVDIAEPLFDITLTADHVDETIVGVPGTPGPSGGQALTAWPLVTRGATTFRLRRAARVDGRIDVFDITGRFVRRLFVPAGVRVRDFDGRDANGRRVAPGVAFARWSDGVETRGTRLVIVR